MTSPFLLNNNMESFKEYFNKRYEILNEYRHKDALGGIKQSIHPDNKKGSNITIDPISRKIPWTKGPYEKHYKPGKILIGRELYKALNGAAFSDGKEVKMKSPNQILKLFTNLHGQECGKIVEVKK